MSDNELKLGLARLLPNLIEVVEHSTMNQDGYDDSTGFYWDLGDEIQETEWLHVCWLIEHQMSEIEQAHYQDLLAFQFVGPSETFPFHACFCASWQQRATAILKLKSKGE